MAVVFDAAGLRPPFSCLLIIEEFIPTRHAHFSPEELHISIFPFLLILLRGVDRDVGLTMVRFLIIFHYDCLPLLRSITLLFLLGTKRRRLRHDVHVLDDAGGIL